MQYRASLVELGDTDGSNQVAIKTTDHAAGATGRGPPATFALRNLSGHEVRAVSPQLCCHRSASRRTRVKRPWSRTISVEASAARTSSGALLHPIWRVTRQISRPTSFLSRPRGPTWTSRRPTRSGQLRPRWRLRWMCYAFAFPSACVELGAIGARISVTAPM
jgi:hypothetical protein